MKPGSALSPMHLMNDRWMTAWCRVLLIFLWGGALSPAANGAERLHFGKRLTREDRQCLSELFRASHWNAMPTWERDMIADARAARTKLSNDGRDGYIFLIDGRGWCGSAGCTLLIGEREANGACRLLFSGSGWYSARVLPRRDHGYHRLYLPCEIRFDGKEYRQLREECPNVNVIH